MKSFTFILLPKANVGPIGVSIMAYLPARMSELDINPNGKDVLKHRWLMDGDCPSCKG
jgi:hypothetical protein